MMGKQSRFQSSKKHHPDSGFGLIEVMVSLVILAIASVGIGELLAASSQQLNTLGYVSQSQQCGMENATALTGSVPCTGASPVQQTVMVNIVAVAKSSLPVPVAAVSSPVQSLPSNQQPPAWWQP